MDPRCTYVKKVKIDQKMEKNLTFWQNDIFANRHDIE